jgi:hypothetical protein
VLELDARAAALGGREAHLDLGGVVGVAARVPGEHEPVRWLPGQHLAPPAGAAVDRALDEPAGAVGAHRHQPGVAQHPQVLADRGLAHGGGVGQLTDALLATAQQLEHRPPGGVAEGVENTCFIGHHLS